ncbi:MAG TPA: thioredoxin family protein [Thermoanaerobaculia bacterium]|nr:thioredoxin family protein [Thermoanaerobaculia bacterium]
MEIPNYEDPADVQAGIQAARAQAAQQGKRVAIVFGADWCPDCYAFESSLKHRLVAPIVEPAFVVLKVSVGNRNRNIDLMEGYGMVVENGIPAVAILDPDGHLVASQRHGEFRNASSLLSVAEIVSFFHRWAPARV